MRALAGSHAGRVLVLTGAMVIVCALLLPIAYQWKGSPGGWSAAIAGGVCWISGLIALWLVRKDEDPTSVGRMLWGMLPRMGIPLAACLGVHIHGGTLAKSGFVYYILVFYLVMLAVETGLMIGSRPKNATDTQAT